MINHSNTSLPIDSARWTRELHESIRSTLEQDSEGFWRVVAINETSTTSYQATLKTAKDEIPEYMLSEVLSTFVVQLVENGPLEKIVDGHIFKQRLNKFQCEIHQRWHTTNSVEPV
jgi:hypothetical protein